MVLYMYMGFDSFDFAILKFIVQAPPIQTSQSFTHGAWDCQCREANAKTTGIGPFWFPREYMIASIWPRK